MTNRLAVLAQWSVRQELNRVSSVQFTYVALYALLRALKTIGLYLYHSVFGT